MEFIGIIFFLGVLTASNEALACSYNAHVNGPSLVCPSTTYEFWTDIPPEIFCGSYTVEEWSITVGQGYAHFVDQSGNDLGSYLVCDQYTPNAPCRPSGIVRIRTNSYYGSFGYRVVGHCSQAGTATRDYTVAIGLPPPNSISGPADGCVGNIITLSATPVTSANSYTWNVPNSTWKVDGVAGPSVTLPIPPVADPTTVTVTIGTSPGNGSVSVRANTTACPGNGVTYKNVAVYSHSPSSLQNFSGPTMACLSDFVVFSATSDPYATSYQLQLLNGDGSYIFTLENSSSVIGFEPDYYIINPGTYLFGMRGVSLCGDGPWVYQSIVLNSCGGGCGQMCLMASPVPSDNILNLSISPNAESLKNKTFSKNKFDLSLFDVHLYSAKSGKSYFLKSLKDKNYQIDTSTMPDDIYVLKVSGHGLEKSINVMVKH